MKKLQGIKKNVVEYGHMAIYDSNENIVKVRCFHITMSAHLTISPIVKFDMEE